MYTGFYTLNEFSNELDTNLNYLVIGSTSSRVLQMQQKFISHLLAVKFNLPSKSILLRCEIMYDHHSFQL